MSRIARNINNWGTGDLNGAPSSQKTNGSQIKRYGPLGIAGVQGVVRKNGKEHEYVFELSGQEVLTENGVPATGVLFNELTDGVGLLLNDITVVVHEAFAVGDVANVGLSAQPVAGGVFSDNLVAAVPLDAVGVVKLATLIAGPYSVDADGNIQVFEEGGSLFFNFDGMTAGVGKAEVIMNYISL